jgi:hypothetical protein
MTVALKLTRTVCGTKRPLPILGKHSARRTPNNSIKRLMRVGNRDFVVSKGQIATLIIVSAVFSPAGDAAPRSEAARQAASERSGAWEQDSKIVFDLSLLRRAAPLVDLVGAY